MPPHTAPENTAADRAGVVPSLSPSTPPTTAPAMLVPRINPPTAGLLKTLPLGELGPSVRTPRKTPPSIPTASPAVIAWGTP